jgi:RNA exonuclease 4
VAQISLVDASETAVLNLYVQQECEVVSYLTPLTGATAAAARVGGAALRGASLIPGLSAELLATKGVPLAVALETLRAHLPPNATLVGQSISTDNRWLGLVEGIDFAGLVDLSGLFRVWNATYKSWSVFSQEHVARCLLGTGGDGCEAHNAVTDAQTSVRLYNLHGALKAGEPGGWERAQASLLASPPHPSFARRCPTFEGVCMGNKKTCTCGAKFVF